MNKPEFTRSSPLQRRPADRLREKWEMTNAQREFLFHDNGWGTYVNRLDVHEVPGDHDSMVLEPNVRVLAARLQKCIQALEPSARRAAAAKVELVTSA